MLSNLASYLGYQLTTPTEVESNVATAVDMRLCPVEEDEWLLVEKQKPSEIVLAMSACPSALPGARPSPLQESWYLTPPPSFTSRGPVHMETSPLENLLIEHPSMSVYQKSDKTPSWKISNSSPSASEEESPLRPSSEDGTPVRLPRNERLNKLPRNKYSKKTTSKRAPTSSSDDAVSLPSASEDETQENKETKVKNFVKSPRRSINVELKNLTKKPSNRRLDNSSSDEMISIPSNNEEDPPALSALAIQPFAPARKLYSDVLRSKPKSTPVVKPLVPKEVSIVEDAPAIDNTPAATSATVETIGEAGISSMVVEDPIVEKDRRHAVQTFPNQHRQHFLNRSAQKLEQRKTCEMAKRNPMGRNNKAREINSRNKRQRRSDMMQRHSGANNNRKCY